jgi:hypothetical protein
MIIHCFYFNDLATEKVCIFPRALVRARGTVLTMDVNKL